MVNRPVYLSGKCDRFPSEGIHFHLELSKDIFYKAWGKLFHVCLEESCTHDLVNPTSLPAAKGPEREKITAAETEFGERSEVSVCICIHWETERENKGSLFVESQHYLRKVQIPT